MVKPKKERKLSLARQFRALDTKHRNFPETLDHEERKEFSTFLSFKYLSNVDGISDLQEYYILAANQQVNKHFFALSKHPNLQWLLCTTVSPGMGVHNHYWLPTKAKKADRRWHQLIESQYPHLNEEEIELMVKINSEDDFKQLSRDLGFE